MEGQFWDPTGPTGFPNRLAMDCKRKKMVMNKIMFTAKLAERIELLFNEGKGYQE